MTNNVLGPIVSRARPVTTPVKPDLQRRLDEAAKAAAPRSVMSNVTYSANDTVTSAMLQRDRSAIAKRNGVAAHEKPDDALEEWVRACNAIAKQRGATAHEARAAKLNKGPKPKNLWMQLLGARNKVQDLKIKHCGELVAENWLNWKYEEHGASPVALACVPEANQAALLKVFLAEIVAAPSTVYGKEAKEAYVPLAEGRSVPVSIDPAKSVSQTVTVKTGIWGDSGFKSTKYRGR